MSSSSLGWNEALVLFDGHQVSVDLVEHKQPRISPPIFKTSQVHGAEHIYDTGFVSMSILHIYLSALRFTISTFFVLF